MNRDDYELVKMVNSALTERRDHRAAWKRFCAASPEVKDVFREAFRYVQTKDEVGEVWDRFDPEDDDGHSYFVVDELNAIVGVIGASW